MSNEAKPITPETLAKFKKKITEMHHDLLDLLNGYDIIWDELTELEDMADKELGTHLVEDSERMQGAPWLEDEELNK